MTSTASGLNAFRLYRSCQVLPDSLSYTAFVPIYALFAMIGEIRGKFRDFPRGEGVRCTRHESRADGRATRAGGVAFSGRASRGAFSSRLGAAAALASARGKRALCVWRARDRSAEHVYFLGGEAANWLDRTVGVRTINSLPLKQWIVEFRRLKALNEQIMRTRKAGRKTGR